MSVLYLMLPMALVIAGFFVWVFIRSVRGGQFDDLDTPPIRAIFDEDGAAPGDRPHAERPSD
jgi:cbb3-type cytochrome oxidase maturation protein